MPFGKIWILIGFSLFIFIFIWNGFWITRQVGPLPKDDANLWAYHRRRVTKEGERAVVLIGSSRMQTGLAQAKFTELTGYNTIQLAIAGESPIPVLQNLSEDESFKGIVISDFSEFLVYTRELYSNSDQLVNQWIREFKESKSSDDFEFMLRGYSRYLLANPTLGDNPSDSLINIITGKAFKMRSTHKIAFEAKQTHFDRALIFDFDLYLSKEDKDAINDLNKKSAIKGLKDFIENTSAEHERFLSIVVKIERYIQKINARGGKVIIVNFPMSGELERLNEIAFPREQFWDVMTKNSSADFIHYKDYLQLQFDCPDGSHLEAKVTPQFNENLVKIISEKIKACITLK